MEIMLLMISNKRLWNRLSQQKVGFSLAEHPLTNPPSTAMISRMFIQLILTKFREMLEYSRANVNSQTLMLLALDVPKLKSRCKTSVCSSVHWIIKKIRLECKRAQVGEILLVFWMCLMSQRKRFWQKAKVYYLYQITETLWVNSALTTRWSVAKFLLSGWSKSQTLMRNCLLFLKTTIDRPLLKSHPSIIK